MAKIRHIQLDYGSVFHRWKAAIGTIKNLKCPTAARLELSLYLSLIPQDAQSRIGLSADL